MCVCLLGQAEVDCRYYQNQQIGMLHHQYFELPCIYMSIHSCFYQQVCPSIDINTQLNKTTVETVKGFDCIQTNNVCHSLTKGLQK